MEFDINPNELSLQGPDGMQLVQILRKLIVAIDGGDEPQPVETSGLYYCTYGTTTSAQIAQAITDGLLPVCVYGGRYYYLVYRQVNIFTFACADNTQLILYRIKCNGSNWSYNSTYLQSLLDFDYAPTEGSTNPVTSGGVWTAIQQGGGGSDIDPYQQYPAMDGTASPGSSNDYARGDHVHPTDTSRAAASEITRIDAALATKADQASIQQTIEDTVDDWLTAQAPSIGTLSYAAKQALLACFRKVAWIDNQGPAYYSTLENALFPDATLESISAVFTQGTAIIYDTDSLDVLRQYLVVTATYSDSTTETVEYYSLSGTLEAGTSTITVDYDGKTTTFSVTVTAGPLYIFDARDYTIDTVSGNREYLQVSGTNHFKFYNYRGGGYDWAYAGISETAKTSRTWAKIFDVSANDNVVLKLKNGYVKTDRTSGKVFINTSLRNTSGGRLWGWTANDTTNPLYIDASITNRIDFTELTMNITPTSNASIGCIQFYSWGDFQAGTTQYTQITFECDWEVWVNGTRYI